MNPPKVPKEMKNLISVDFRIERANPPYQSIYATVLRQNLIKAADWCKEDKMAIIEEWPSVCPKREKKICQEHH